MYCDFYQMRERPFNVTADPRFLYLNARYREALASLNYGITQRKGFVTLIGEAGTGKTTLLKKLLDDLDTATRTVFIFNTNVTFDEILEYTFSELDLPVHNGKRLYMLQRLNDYLLDELRAGRNVALLIDEAQDLDYSVLEDLRLLSNLETATEKILQIVLSGQPELAEKLANPRLRQLRQRISVNCRLLSLSREELSEYIGSRLAAAGSADPKLFSREAEDRIFEISHGIPRLVNVLCDNALVIGYALGKKRIGADVVNEAAADLLPVEARSEDEGAAPAPVPVERAAEVVESARRVPSLGIVAVVLVAIAVGLLSVGRTLLRPSESAAPPEIPLASDVIQPGTRMAERGDAVVEPRAMEPRVADAEVARPPEVQAESIDSEPTDAEMAALQPEDVRVGADAGDPARRAELGEPASAVAEPPSAAERPAVGGTAVGAGGVWPPARPAAQAPAAAESDRGAAERGSVAAWRTEPESGSQSAAALDPLLESGPGAVGRDDYRVAQSRYQSVVVGRGDSLSAIAVKAYGQSGDTVLDIVKLANPTVVDVDLIPVGKELRLPEIEGGLMFLQDKGGRFTLLLQSSPLRGRANEVAAALRLRGFEAQVVPGSLGAARPVWRVLVGGFSTREEAQSAGRRLRQLIREDERMAAMAR